MSLRACFRLVRAGLHVAGGVLTVALIYPFCSGRIQLALKQRWSQQLLVKLGVGLRVSGNMPAHGLIVANHISFLDIYAINAAMPSSFVSKDDVRSWPVIGWLALKTDTIFMERGSRSAAQRARENLVGHLRAGTRVALFPEGTTSRGETVLPFHGALLQSAIDAGVAVIPVAVRYLDAAGQRSEAAAYVDDMSLIECMRAIASSGHLTASLEILSTLDTEGIDRRHLAAAAHRAIAHAVDRHD